MALLFGQYGPSLFGVLSTCHPSRHFTFAEAYEVNFSVTWSVEILENIVSLIRNEQRAFELEYRSPDPEDLRTQCFILLLSDNGF